ncbi:hypothetical protein D8B34_08960 [Verminephrobacter eiseniae]|nr:hypothetical protein [Verminephrobacter eiseniae]MCW5294877.1 hypothetical protein [Verminephrobacter eiseniae]MCW8183758.1 hypothetical protein [Verminephrobacter eiseniae]MCW8222302.1 hypothetical protein [Verminephrobacter eiseniae]MCW8233899.1 hypothetical protein [Verminephrobacter eiseniae]
MRRCACRCALQSRLLDTHRTFTVAPILAPLIIVGSACLALGLGGWGLALLQRAAPAAPPAARSMLLAPMIGVIDTCVLLPATARSTPLEQACTDPARGSAAALVESTLTALQPRRGGAQRYPLGYTLPVPLLQLFRQTPEGWAVDMERVQRLARTIRDTDRPVILYLFATHFSVHSPLEEALAGDPANLAHTRQGPLARDSYYGEPIYPWTFARTDTEITRRRVEATRAMLGALCQLAPEAVAKVKGVTLLGELHHLFPDFQAGMGFTGPYRITDYSAASVQGFRQYLRQQFARIADLNRILGADYPSFDAIFPPAKDIRSEPLQRYTEHLDAFAHGSLPIAGWAYAPGRSSGEPAWVHIYRNGAFIGKTPVNQGRQDVLQALPQLRDANTGWRFDMDFKSLPAGLHRLDIFLEAAPGRLTALGTRHIAIMDRRQTTPRLQAQQALPAGTLAQGGIAAHIDLPREHSSYYYNPMVPLWHAFRGLQVVNYLRFFDDVVSQSCLARTRHYTHQIIPFTNPGWDASKFAVDPSLASFSSLRLGVSLYGAAAYGKYFDPWYRRTRHPSYGITEFHPLKALPWPQLQAVLDGHARQGADFLSFFLEPRWQGRLVERKHNEFSLDPANDRFGSDALYRALAQGLAREIDAPRQASAAP